MIKRYFAILGILFIVIGISAPGYCDDSVKKLGRGVCNMITFPFEILEQVKRTNNSDGPLAAMTYGLLKGGVMSAARAAVGVYETATFLIPLPRNYAPILTDPEFFFEEKNW